MKTAVWGIALLVLAGLVAHPTAAVELRVSGFFDNVIETEQNTSGFDFNLTDNKDKATFGSQRSRLFFNFVASDDMRGIFALEMDATYGAPAGDRLTSAARTPVEAGFRLTIDTNAIGIKHLYVDFRIPQLPFGNRWQIGGIPAEVTPLHPNLLFTNDAGGVDVTLDVSREISLKLTFIQLEEDVERFPGSTKIGEDYLVGGTLMLKPLPAWDLYLPLLFQHLHASFGNFTGIGGPFPLRANDITNVVAESRYYLGVDSRYRLGKLSIEPSFIYLTGTRKFCRPGSQIPGAIVSATSVAGSVGNPVNCTSPTAGGVREINQNAFETTLQLHYTLGKWLLSGKFSYLSGDTATADLNNQGRTRGRTREDVTGFRPAGVDGGNRIGDWLDILGRGNLLSARTQLSPYRMGESGGTGLDRFGY